MSIPNMNKYLTFEYIPSESKINKSSILGYNPNTSKSSRTQIFQVVKDSDVDDYVFNEIKKAKYQGFFDPGSLGNKNIFVDKINRLDNLKFRKKKFIKNNTNFHLHKYDEGKHLLISKSEVQYPLNYGSSNNIINNKSMNYKSTDYYEISTPIKAKKNFKNNKKIKANILNNNNFSYNTPIYNKSELEQNQYNIKDKSSKLNDYYKDNSKRTKKTHKNIKYTINSIDKISDGGSISKNSKNNNLSPITFKNYIVINTHKNNKEKNQKKYYTINPSILNKEKNINYIKDKDINETESNDDEISQEIINIDNDIENDNGNNENDIDSYDESNMIKKYKKKVISFLFDQMYKIHIRYFRNCFNLFISQIKYFIRNKKYHFEDKTIKNIAEIKKKIKTNSFYYGYKKQYYNILNDIKAESEKNINKTEKNKNNQKEKYVMDFHKLDEENNNNKLLIKKRYGIKNKKNIKIKIETENEYICKKEIKSNNISYNVSKKKYVKKNVFQKITHNNKIDKKPNQREFHSFRNNYNDINKEDKKIRKSYNRKELMNNNNSKSDNNIINKDNKNNTNIVKISSTLTKNYSQIMPRVFKKANNHNSFKMNKSNKKYIINNSKYKSVNLSEKIEIDKINIYKNQYEYYDKNYLQIHDILKGKTNDEKLNMNIKYLDIDNNIKSTDKKNKNKNKNIYMIDNISMYTIKGISKENKNSSIGDENNIKILSNNNIQNAITIITKIIKNKEKDEKMYKINSLLYKIIDNKINIEKKHNYELIKKYFNIFKYEYNNNTKKQSSNTKQLDDRQDLAKIIYNKNKLLFKKKGFSDKKKKKKNVLEINSGESQIINSSGRQFRAAKTKIYCKNILNRQMKKIKIMPIKISKKSYSEIFDKDNIPYKKQINQSVSLTMNDNSEILNNNYNNSSINKIITQELIGNNTEKEKKIEIINIEKNKDFSNENNNEINMEDDKELEKEKNIVINIEEDKELEKEKNIVFINMEKNKQNAKEKEKWQNILKQKSLEIKNDIDFDNHAKNALKINNEKSEELNDIYVNSEKNIRRTYAIIKRKNNMLKDKRKSMIIKKKKSIGSFIKNRMSLNKSNNKTINEDDIALNEKYQDYKNLIYLLRIQLINCFISNKKINESCFD